MRNIFFTKNVERDSLWWRKEGELRWREESELGEDYLVRLGNDRAKRTSRIPFLTSIVVKADDMVYSPLHGGRHFPIPHAIARDEINSTGILVWPTLHSETAAPEKP
jgi:hypothetical protein